MQITDIPEWIGAAFLGAILALLGYVGKQIAEWGARLRTEEKSRRTRLTELLALIKAGNVAWKIQCENRNRLAELIKTRVPALAGHGYDRLFALAYPTMSPEERELHTIIRAMTVYTIQPINEKLLQWLSADTEFRIRPIGNSPRAQLAKYLYELEAHLLLWKAKFQAWIPEHPEHALVYLADEERHGIGFPKNGMEIVTRVQESRWIGG